MSDESRVEVELSLTINGFDVEPCKCGGTPTHWSVKDLIDRLDRVLVDSDRINVTARVKEECLSCGVQLTPGTEGNVAHCDCEGCFCDEE